jgi:hypothetical protein
MKLPNSGHAYVEIAKLRDYSLNPMHPEGKHKARVFAAALGVSRDDAEWLREQLLRAAEDFDCVLGRRTTHGQRYLLDFDVMNGSKSARLRSVWNVRPHEDFPRLISCYVL